jgi:hypothetical protein
MEKDPDAERWRFLADHQLTLHTAGDEYLVHLVRRGEPPKFLPVSRGGTADEAIDAAIARYEHALDQRNVLRKF